MNSVVLHLLHNSNRAVSELNGLDIVGIICRIVVLLGNIIVGVCNELIMQLLQNVYLNNQLLQS